MKKVIQSKSYWPAWIAIMILAALTPVVFSHMAVRDDEIRYECEKRTIMNEKSAWTESSEVHPSASGGAGGGSGGGGGDQWQIGLCHNGTRQSPINIEIKSVQERCLPELYLRHYDTFAFRASIQNNGHTALLKYKHWFVGPTLSGGPLRRDTKYVFEQLHFHWGDNSQHGSEHTINGKRFPMELHLVHYNRPHGSVAEAAQHQDGIVVLAFFFQISAKENKKWAPLVSVLPNIYAKPGAKKRVFLPPKLATLFPEKFESSSYFSYYGSLTTPPCSESVNWIIFQQPIKISEQQMSKFRGLRDASGHVISNNFRRLQSINERVVIRGPADDSFVEQLIQ